MDSQNGFAVAIAWPDFRGKQAGSWYDPLMRFLGINKKFHYRVGHASLILVNPEGTCYYFDCGRYEAPYQKGRIRDASTDCALEIRARAALKDGKITNIREILTEIQLNEACKGSGVLRAAYCPVDFETAYAHAKKFQERGILPFGPFVRPGTNCCRFVQQSILNGNPESKHRWKLKMLFPLLPKPLTIVWVLPNKAQIPVREELPGYEAIAHLYEDLFDARSCYDLSNVKATLQAPEKPVNVPAGSQWLGGEVSGSWFHITREADRYFISRYSENGSKKCRGHFRLNSPSGFDIGKPFSFSYLSHCSKSTIVQGEKLFEFVRSQ